MFRYKEFSTLRHSWLQLFPPPNVFHYEAFSTPQTFSTTRHFQVQFLGSRLINGSQNMEKLKKKVSYHCSDRIIYIRLIQNEPLTPTAHPTRASYTTRHFPLWGIFHIENIFYIFSFDSLAHIQLPAPEIWKSWKKGIISLLRQNNVY